MIFGVRPSSLFTSRWMALLWSVLICLMAVGFVGGGGGEGGGRNGDQAAAPTDATGDPITAQDVAALRNAVEAQ
jgi:hypothetical protein